MRTFGTAGGMFLRRNSPAQRSPTQPDLDEFLVTWGAESAVCGLLRNSPAQRSLTQPDVGEFLITWGAESALSARRRSMWAGKIGYRHEFPPRPVSPFEGVADGGNSVQSPFFRIRYFCHRLLGAADWQDPELAAAIDPVGIEIRMTDGEHGRQAFAASPPTSESPGEFSR